MAPHVRTQVVEGRGGTCVIVQDTQDGEGIALYTENGDLLIEMDPGRARQLATLLFAFSTTGPSGQPRDR